MNNRHFTFFCPPLRFSSWRTLYGHLSTRIDYKDTLALKRHHQSFSRFFRLRIALHTLSPRSLPSLGIGCNDHIDQSQNQMLTDKLVCKLLNECHQLCGTGRVISAHSVIGR